jgi:hypothetical protein
MNKSKRNGRCQASCAAGRRSDSEHIMPMPSQEGPTRRRRRSDCFTSCKYTRLSWRCRTRNCSGSDRGRGRAQSRYTDLYEFAPGRVPDPESGRRDSAGESHGSAPVGLERSHLVGKRLAVMVDADSRPVFNAFLSKVFGTGHKETCEVVVRPEVASPFAVEFAATASAGGEECRVVARISPPASAPKH